MSKFFALWFSFLLVFTANFLKSQVVYENPYENSIYDFLDEMANEQIISLVSVTKPYTRMFITEKLILISESNQLNKRQKAELDFYMKDYGLCNNLPSAVIFDVLKKKENTVITLNPPGLHYKDSIFLLSVRPVMGLHAFSNNKGFIYHRFNGAEAFGEINKHLSVYASLVDNNESQIMAKEDFLTQRMGANYKKNVNNSGRNDYSEMRGGIIYSFKWGHFGLVKDHIMWGNNYNGANIFSGRTPSFAHIKLHLQPTDWLQFDYFHGWLVSEVIDSSRSYYDSQNVYRGVFHEKYLAANLFTLTPFKRLDFSFGNSIVYSDIGVQPAYLIPVMFYKSVDHSLNSTSNYRGQNSQMFFDISSRQIPNTHLFATLFIDEIMLSTMFDKNKQRNELSFKGGFKISNIISNFFLTGEYTRTNPWTYRHSISTTTFASNTYNLGHYLRENAEEYFVALGYKPLRGLCFSASYTKALKGEQHAYTSNGSTSATPFLDKIIWKNETYSFKVFYDLFNKTRLFGGFSYSEIEDDLGIYSPDFLKGTQRTFSFGAHVGF
ncbi:MAG: hypothetical protein PHT69_01425 [Bacteroidales bacterium]|nr:hypothetical protein [Bacteroidales bacterium]